MVGLKAGFFILLAISSVSFYCFTVSFMSQLIRGYDKKEKKQVENTFLIVLLVDELTLVFCKLILLDVVTQKNRQSILILKEKKISVLSVRTQKLCQFKTTTMLLFAKHYNFANCRLTTFESDYCFHFLTKTYWRILVLHNQLGP